MKGRAHGAATPVSYSAPALASRCALLCPAGDGDGWQAADAGSAKRSRRLSARQVQLLEKNFALGVPALEPAVKKLLALELGMEPRQVAVWFQNRRARSRSKQLEVCMDALKASFAKLAEQHRELGEEVQLLRAIVSAHTGAQMHPGVVGVDVSARGRTAGLAAHCIAPCQDASSPISSTSVDSIRCSHAGGAGADDVPSLPMQPRHPTSAVGGRGEMLPSAVSCGVQAGDARFIAAPPPAAPPAPAPASANSEKSACSSLTIFDGKPIATGCSLPVLEAIADAGAAAGGSQPQAAIELPELCDVWEVHENHLLWPYLEDEALFLC